MECHSVLLEGRVALVTGAGRGIGAAIARIFAKEGARLVLAGRGDGVESVAADIRAGGGVAEAARGDLREEAHAKELVQRCRKEHGRIDVLVNNAGVMRQSLLGMLPGEA